MIQYDTAKGNGQVTMDIMDFTRTVEFMTDEQKKQFGGFLSEYMPKTNLMLNVLEILEDNGPYSMTLSKQNREALVRLLFNYVDSCWPIFLDDVNIKSLFQYAQTEVYHIQAENGYRVATNNEVENGVLGLIGEVTDNIPEKEQKLLHLLQWTFDGDWREFKAAGFDVKFNSDRTVATTYMQMIKQSATLLNDLIDFTSEGRQFDYCLTQLRRVKRLGKYKYPQYAADEIKVDMPLKSLAFALKNQLPKGSGNSDIRKAWYLTLTYYNNNRVKLKPSEVSFLRQVYADLNTQEGVSKFKDSASAKGSPEIQANCEKLLNALNSGLIDPNHFAFKIIGTLKENGYKRISSKQQAVLDSAMREVEVKQRAKAKEIVEITSNIINIDEVDESDMPNIFDVASMLGDGLIGKL